MGAAGGIKSHLDKLREAVVVWLDYEAEVDEEDEEKVKLRYQLENKELPKQPEALGTLRLLRRFNFTHLYYSGGISNQPYIWWQEINAAIEGEYDYEKMKIAQARLLENLKKKAANL
jgi:hypothetical protein